MINEMENKASLDQMSDLEFGKNKLEMMRYRVNGLSYKLGLLALVLSIFGAFVCLNSTQPKTFVVIIKILMNIAVLLAGFLCVEKARNYSKQGSIGLIVIGGVCAARIFWIPIQLIVYYNKYVAALDAGDSAAKEAATKYIGKTITGYFENGAVRWLPYSGNFRGVLAIILLAGAALCFIGAGVVGYMRSQKLTQYLDSLKEAK